MNYSAKKTIPSFTLFLSIALAQGVAHGNPDTLLCLQVIQKSKPVSPLGIKWLPTDTEDLRQLDKNKNQGKNGLKQILSTSQAWALLQKDIQLILRSEASLGLKSLVFNDLVGLFGEASEQGYSMAEVNALAEASFGGVAHPMADISSLGEANSVASVSGATDSSNSFSSSASSGSVKPRAFDVVSLLSAPSSNVPSSTVTLSTVPSSSIVKKKEDVALLNAHLKLAKPLAKDLIKKVVIPMPVLSQMIRVRNSYAKHLEAIKHESERNDFVFLKARGQEDLDPLVVKSKNWGRVLQLVKVSFVVEQLMGGIPLSDIRLEMSSEDIHHLATAFFVTGPGRIENQNLIMSAEVSETSTGKKDAFMVGERNFNEYFNRTNTPFRLENSFVEVLRRPDLPWKAKGELSVIYSDTKAFVDLLNQEYKNR